MIKSHPYQIYLTTILIEAILILSNHTPILWLIVRSYVNAILLVLFETLQISKTEYEDDDEVVLK